jgi:DNA processing protein
MERPQREYLIGLNLIPALTPRRMERLLHHFPTPQTAWEATAEELAAVSGFADVAAKIASERSERALDRELARCAERKIRFVTRLDRDYPPLLREISAPPAVLYVKGEGLLDATRTVAIVGTRRSSRYGRAVAERLAGDLAQRRFVVVSGLAIGIDASAHRGALKAGGVTAAVLGAGFLHPYPACNKELAQEIIQNGLLVSEYALDTRPTKWTFPQRNRILSGLARGVVVVEAPERSGALITAQLALDQGREVFAVPGNVTNTASCGANRLIQEGAKLVASVEDILEEFPDLAPVPAIAPEDAKTAASGLSDIERQVYEMIGLEPMHIDDIIARGGLSPSEAAHTVLLLQFKHLIQEVEGRRYIRTL